MTYNISSISSNTGNFFLSFTYTRYGSSILPFGEGAALGICVCLVVKIVSNSTIFNWHMLEIKMALCNIFVILIKTKKAPTASVEQNVNMLTRGDNYENYPASSGYPIRVCVVHICTSHLIQFLSALLRWTWGADSCKRIVRFFSPLTSQMNFKCWSSVRNRFYNFIFRGWFGFRAVKKMLMLYLENCILVKEIDLRSIKIIFTTPLLNEAFSRHKQIHFSV